MQVEWEAGDWFEVMGRRLLTDQGRRKLQAIRAREAHVGRPKPPAAVEATRNRHRARREALFAGDLDRAVDAMRAEGYGLAPIAGVLREAGILVSAEVVKNRLKDRGIIA